LAGESGSEISVLVEPLSIASDPAASKTDQPSERTQTIGASNGARRSESRIERRAPNARESMATLPDGEANDFDFEPHDTIPAPPWLEDEFGGAGATSTNEIAAPHKS
jgi:hypothetical protein